MLPACTVLVTFGRNTSIAQGPLKASSKLLTPLHLHLLPAVTWKFKRPEPSNVVDCGFEAGTRTQQILNVVLSAVHHAYLAQLTSQLNDLAAALLADFCPAAAAAVVRPSRSHAILGTGLSRAPAIALQQPRLHLQNASGAA